LLVQLLTDQLPFPQGREVVSSKHGYPAKVDKTAKQVTADEFDGVIVPGGYSPDHLRRCPRVVELVKEINDRGGVVAAICHGGWVPVSSGVIKGRKATSFFAIKDDMVNAGAEWVDEEVVADGNLITSRTPADLPAFMRAIIKTLAG
jgi:protease I